LDRNVRLASEDELGAAAFTRQFEIRSVSSDFEVDAILICFIFHN